MKITGDHFMHKGFAVFLIILSLIAPTASHADISLLTLPYIFLPGLRPGVIEEDYVHGLVDRVRSYYDTNGGGLDAQDAEASIEIRTASQRSSIIASFLRADLNGDGSLTQQELTTSQSYETHGRQMPQEQFNQMLSQRLADVMDADTDGDKVVSLAEIMATASRRSAETTNGENITAETKELLALDPNGDGRLTYREMGDISRAAFRSIDTDSDGVLSDAEVAVVASTIRQAQVEHEFMPCDLPKAAANGRLIVIGADEGAGQPTVTTVGTGRVTNLADITIQPGDDPIYLVAFSYKPMIWRLNGAVSRVSQLAISAAGGGAVNIDADRVTFLRPRSCVGNFGQADSEQGKAAANVIARAAGVAPFAVLTTHIASTLMLPPDVPSADADQAQSATGNADNAVRVFTGNKVFIIQNTKIAEQQSNPSAIAGGNVARANDQLTNEEDMFTRDRLLVQIDPKTVVAASPVTSYDILPNQWGLKQLVADGHLVHDGNAYRILKTFAHFPAEMTGSHSVTFILPVGIEMPAGDLGHSKLIKEGSDNATQP